MRERASKKEKNKGKIRKLTQTIQVRGVSKVGSL